jgi:hypothetical protein
VLCTRFRLTEITSGNKNKRIVLGIFDLPVIPGGKDYKDHSLKPVLAKN